MTGRLDQMQTQKPALLLRMYGSMDAARVALAEEAREREAPKVSFD